MAPEYYAPYRSIVHESVVTPRHVGFANLAGRRVACVIHELFQLSLYSIVRRRPLTMPEFLMMAWKLTSRLAKLHTDGYVHLNLKPTNILFRRGEVFFIDPGSGGDAAVT